MNKIKASILGILGALLLALGLIDGVYAVDNNISGTAPTQNTDNTALTDLASIQVSKALAASVAGCTSATYTVLTTIPFTTAGGTFTYLDANQTQNGTYCYKATAIDTAGNVSTFSNIATKNVDLLFPKAPTITVS